MAFINIVAAAAVAACNFGARAPDAPEELEQYAFLIGDHEIEARVWDSDARAWKEPAAETRWSGRWALDGHAIYDEWTDPAAPGAQAGRGANFRMWDAANKRWSNMWMHTDEARTTDILSEMRNGKMVMWQVYPEPAPEWRAEFEVHDDGGWTRIHYVKDETGAFQPRFRLDARKLPCEIGAP